MDRRPTPPGGDELIALIRRVGFGSIHNLRVAGGRPVLDPFPRVVQQIKFGGGFRPAGPRPVAPLLHEDKQLIATLAAIGDGVIDGLEVRHGLAFLLTRSLEPLHGSTRAEG